MNRCIECGSRLSGRVDKKFCADPCRSAWHNKRNKEKMRYVNAVNRALRHNRRLLFDLIEAGERRVRRSDLSLRGFDFSYHTHVQITPEGRKFTFCYDVGFRELGDDRLAIVLRDSEGCSLKSHRANENLT